MEKEQMDYAESALRALRRAAFKVAENARKNGIKIPIWKNGRIEYIIPNLEPDARDLTDELSGFTGTKG